jgi:hypothetical protein
MIQNYFLTHIRYYRMEWWKNCGGLGKGGVDRAFHKMETRKKTGTMGTHFFMRFAPAMFSMHNWISKKRGKSWKNYLYRAPESNKREEIEWDAAIEKTVKNHVCPHGQRGRINASWVYICQ